MSDKNDKTKVGDGIAADNASWTFSGDVPKTFSSHVRRSVPLYEEGHQLVCALSDFFVKEDSVCYELGTSVGELLFKLAQRHSAKPNTRWVGIDVEENMIAKAKENNPGLKNVDLIADNINLVSFEHSDLVVAYYCIQFIHPKFRQELFNKIYTSLNWGGALILFEKVRAPDARFQDIMTTLYSDYKLGQEYSPEEIISKTRSLKGVLEPFSTQGNVDLMRRAGFVDITSVMKYVCFEGFLAIK